MSSYAERATAGISRYTPADHADLRQFQARMYGERAGLVPTARLEWLYTANPHCESGDIGVWICRRGDEIVGQQAEWPCRLQVDDTEVDAAYAVELMVDPRWRLRGVGPALAAEQRRHHRVTCAVWMTPEVRRMYERSGWTDLGVISRSVLLVRASAVRRAAASRRQRVIAAVVAPFAALASIPASIVRRAHTSGSQLVPVEQFDEWADEVWRHAAPDYRVIGRRDAASLRWRFDRSAYADRYRRYIFVKGGRTTGYVVLRRTETRGAVVLRIVDYLAPRRDLLALFAHCARIAKDEPRVGFLDVLIRNECAPHMLWPLGFVPAHRFRWLARFTSEVHVMVTLDDDDPLRAEFADREGWFLTGGDADIDLLELQEDLAEAP